MPRWKGEPAWGEVHGQNPEEAKRPLLGEEHGQVQFLSKELSLHVFWMSVEPEPRNVVFCWNWLLYALYLCDETGGKQVFHNVHNKEFLIKNVVLFPLLGKELFIRQVLVL